MHNAVIVPVRATRCRYRPRAWVWVRLAWPGSAAQGKPRRRQAGQAVALRRPGKTRKVSPGFEKYCKFESMEWNTGGSRKTKFKITRTTMITIFWDIEDVMNMDCLHRGMTVSRQCNVDLFLTLQKTIEDGQQGKLRLGVHLQYDDAPVHEPSCHTCFVRLWVQPATTKTFLYLADLVPRKRALWANDILMTMS